MNKITQDNRQEVTLNNAMLIILSSIADLINLTIIRRGDCGKMLSLSVYNLKVETGQRSL